MTAKLRDHMEKLNIFLAVARAGSFHGAAHVLRLSQPSLSHSIQVLEGVIEQQLFHRSRKGVQLTNAGLELLKFSERLAVEVDGLEQRIRSGQEMAGSLNVGTYASFVTYLWPPFLKDFADKFEDLSINLKTLSASDVAAALTSRQCHFVVSTLNLSGKEVQTVDLYKDSYSFFCIEALKKKPLKDLPVIYVPAAEGGSGETLDQLLWQSGITFKKSYELDTFEAVKSLAVEGLGIALLPQRVAQVEKNKLKAAANSGVYSKKIGEHKIRGHYLAADEKDPRLKTFMDELKKWCSHA